MGEPLEKPLRRHIQNCSRLIQMLKFVVRKTFEHFFAAIPLMVHRLLARPLEHSMHFVSILSLIAVIMIWVRNSPPKRSLLAQSPLHPLKMAHQRRKT